MDDKEAAKARGIEILDGLLLHGVRAKEKPEKESQNPEKPPFTPR